MATTQNAKINTGILNNYSIKPKSLTQYTAYRGVIDFSQLAQFDPYETGFCFLSVLKMPTFMEVLAKNSSDVQTMENSFRHLLEYEFRGLSGLPDTTAETLELGDGINTVNIIKSTTRDTSITVSTPYYERSGSLITKYLEYYLSGISDPMSKAKTYHGLIANGALAPNIENETFTFLYYATDNTMMRLEKAWLLCDVQPTKAETSMYDGTKGDIDRKELSIDWNCFPITGYEVDKAANVLLQDITGVSTGYSNGVATYTPTGTVSENDSSFKSKVHPYDIDYGPAALDSSAYKYGVLGVPGESGHVSPSANELLQAAYAKATSEQ